MNNRSESFVSGNREQFDGEKPPGSVWDSIGKELDGKKENRKILRSIARWTMAAAAVLVIGSIIFVKQSQLPGTGNTVHNNEYRVDELAPEYAPQVNAFAKLISVKEEELKMMAKEQPELYRKFTSDMEILDSSYQALKQKLYSGANKEQLAEAMIENLQMRINILNEQLKIIKEVKQSKKYSHEKNYQNI